MLRHAPPPSSARPSPRTRTTLGSAPPIVGLSLDAHYARQAHSPPLAQHYHAHEPRDPLRENTSPCVCLNQGRPLGIANPCLVVPIGAARSSGQPPGKGLCVRKLANNALFWPLGRADSPWLQAGAVVRTVVEPSG